MQMSNLQCDLACLMTAVSRHGMVVRNGAFQASYTFQTIIRTQAILTKNTRMFVIWGIISSYKMTT